MSGKRRIAYLIQDLHIGGTESFLYRTAEALKDEFDFIFIASHVPEILPQFHQIGTAVYLGQRYWRIMRYLRQMKVDLVQYSSLRQYGDAALAAGVPVVIERTDGLRGGSALRSKRGLDAVIASTAGTIAPISKLIPRHRIHLIYNGMDVQRFDQAVPNRLGFSSNDILIGRVSRFTEGKNLKLLIDAMRVLHTRHPKARLILVGGDSKMPSAHNVGAELRAYAQGLDACVHFTGYVEDPTNIIKGFDIGTCVSRPNNEGIPNSLLECMACAQPVVATHVDDIPEIVFDGKNGFLIEDNNLEQCIQALDQLIGNAALRREFGRAGQALILSEFNITRQAAKYAELYRCLLSNPMPSRARFYRTQQFKIVLCFSLLFARVVPEPLHQFVRRVRGKLRRLAQSAAMRYGKEHDQKS